MAAQLSTLFLFVASLGVSHGSIQCYQCASPQLKDNWQLTSFPGRIADAGFLYDCGAQKSMSSVNGIPTVDCNTECVTYLFTMPSNKGGATDPGVIVRGCYGYLMGNADYTRPTKENCLWGYAQDTDMISGADITVRSQMQFGTGALSNGEATQWNPSCSNHTAVSCYECETTGSDCTTGTCTGQYCYKSYATFNGRRNVKKGCAGANPYQQNLCMDVRTDVDVPQRSAGPRSAAIQYKGRTCYCNGNQCNGVGAVGASISLLSLLLFARLI